MTTTKKSNRAEISLSGLNTSQAIRLVASKAPDQKTRVAFTYNYLKGKVTTKTGGEIRYQHVRNVLMTLLTSK